MAHDVLLVDLAQPRDTALAGHLILSGFGLRPAAELADAARIVRRESVSAAVVRVAPSPPPALEEGFRGLAGVPVLALCAAPDSDLAVRLLEAGADTVLAAPVSRRELAARLQALLRYQSVSGNGDGMPQFVPQRVGALVVDPGNHTVSKNGDAVALTPTEFRLLRALARHEGEVVSHRDLLTEVWGRNCSAGQEKLRLYVGYLRRKLRDDDEPRLLRNERGVGYRLVATANGSHGHSGSNGRNGRNGHGE